MKFFYSDLIKIDTVITELDGLGLSEEQKMHLAVLLDSTLHYTVLDVILSKLTKEDQVVFIIQLKENAEDRIVLDFLSDKINNLEEEITTVVEELKVSLLEDIKEAVKIK